MNQSRGNFRGGRAFYRGARGMPYMKNNARNFNQNFNNNGNSSNRQNESSHYNNNNAQSWTMQNDNKLKIDECESIKRLKDISIMPYMERRNLKAIMSGNPRFHLVGFNNVPSYIKTSLFIADMALSIPDIKSRNVVSIHTSISNSSPSNVDYLIGFNSTKIIKKLDEMLGTGYVELYKSMVQVIIPDIEATSQCEFNKLVDDEITRNKQPFKLIHKESTLLKMVEMLEEICGDKVNGVSAICCTGEVTYINISQSTLLLKLTNAAKSHGFEIESSETIAVTGTIPSEMMPIEPKNTPINVAATSRLTTEEIIKFNGFKNIYEKYAQEQKDMEVNLIKRSLRECQGVIHSTLGEIENKIVEKVTPLELKVTAGFSRLEEILCRMEMELEIVRQNSTSKLDVKPTTQATRTQPTKPRATKRSAPIYSSTNEIIGNNIKTLEEEISNTRDDD